MMRDGRIAVIDGLRGIAILLVLWLHVWGQSWQAVVIPFVNVSLQPLAETGFIGVPLFFFISGFVLLLPLVQARLAGTPPPTWRQFFFRRATKIVPSYVLCIAVLIAVGYQTYPTIQDAVRDVGFHLLFIHGWFAATYESIAVPMWSLAVEIQFYLLFPLLAFAFVRQPLLTALGMVAVGNAWRLWSLFSNHYFFEQRLNQLPAHIDFFAAGMLCAFVYAWIAMRRPHWTKRSIVFSALMIAGFAAFWLLASDCYNHRFDTEWAQPWKVEWDTALAATFFAMGLGALFAEKPLQRALANPLLLFLAAISYNLYLWHLPIVKTLIAYHIPRAATADPHNDPVWMLGFGFVAVPLAIVVASLLTYGFEVPILKWGRRFERRTLVRAAPGTVAGLPPSMSTKV